MANPISALRPSQASTVTSDPGSKPSRSFESALQSTAPSGEAPATSADVMAELEHSRATSQMLLQLQFQMSQSRTSLVSNLLKVRHETARNSIANIR